MYAKKLYMSLANESKPGFRQYVDLLRMKIRPLLPHNGSILAFEKWEVKPFWLNFGSMRPF